MNDCERCPFKSNIPGDAHISCNHPVYQKDPDLAFKVNIAVMLGISSAITKNLGLTFSRHGVESGWCSYPFNYDPIWIEGECKLLKNYENQSKNLKVNVGTIGHIDHQKSILNIKDLK